MTSAENIQTPSNLDPTRLRRFLYIQVTMYFLLALKCFGRNRLSLDGNTKNYIVFEVQIQSLQKTRGALQQELDQSRSQLFKLQQQITDLQKR